MAERKRTAIYEDLGSAAMKYTSIYKEALGLPTEEDRPEEIDYVRVLSKDVTERSVKDKRTGIRAKNKQKQKSDILGLGDVTDQDIAVAEALEMSRSPEDDSLLPNFGDKDSLFNIRMNGARRRFDERLKEIDPGFFTYAGNLLDVILTDTLDVFTAGGGFGRSGQAEKLRNLASNPNITDEDFYREVEAIIGEAQDAGWLSEENVFYLLAQQGHLQKTDPLDLLGTAAGGLFAIGSIGSGILKGTTAVSRIGKAGSHSDAIQTGRAEVLAGKEGTPVVGVQDTAPTGSTPMHPDRVDLAAPSSGILRAVEQENKVLDTVRELDQGGYIQGDALEANRERLTKLLDEEESFSTNKAYLDHDIFSTDRGNLIGRLSYGKKNGGLYKSKSAAEKRKADYGPDAAVIERVENGEVRYAIQVDVNLPTKGVASATDDNEITTSIFQAISSTNMTTSARLDGIVRRAESQLGVIGREVAELYRAAVGRVTKAERDAVDKVLYEIRDGQFVDQTKPLSAARFAVLYRRAHGSKPSQAVLDYYNQVMELNNTTYYLTADRLFKDAVNRGERILRFGNTDYRVIKTEGLTEDDLVFDLATGRARPATEVKGTKYAVNGGYKADDGATYRFVTGDDKASRTRRIYHTDVLPYNAGGPRLYENVKAYVKQDSSVSYADIGVKPGRPKTFMGTFTEGEARAAAKQLNNIIRKLKDSPILKNYVKNPSYFRQLVETNKATLAPDIDSVIAKNNTWNPEIEDLDDLLKFFDEFNLNLSDDVGVAMDGERLMKADENDIYGFASGGFGGGDESYGTAFVHTLNGRSRRSRPLIGYGNNAPTTVGPTDGIQRSFTRAINLDAENSYTFNAVNGWLKGAERLIQNQDELLGMRPLEALRNAKLSKSKESRAFEQERRVIERRLSHKSDFQVAWENVVDDVAEYVYGKNKAAGIDMRDRFRGDPVAALRSWAFDLKLGLFAFPQLFVQSSQALNVAAIAGSFTPLVAYAPVRIALANPATAKLIGKRVESLLGLEKGQFEDMVKFIRDSGRDVIDPTVAEEAGDFELGLGMVNKVRSAGRVFFKEGEKSIRIAAAVAAYKEMRKVRKGLTGFSQKEINVMTNRMDILSASMTRSSSAAFQRDSLLSIPTQFLSYSMRMMEQLFFDAGKRRILSTAERARLASAQLVFWGLSGYGLGGYFGSLVDNGDVEVSPEMYTAIRYGLLDSIFSSISDSETAAATRLAFGEGVYDIVKSIGEESFVEVAFGPVGGITSDIVGRAFKMVGDVANGRFSMIGTDIEKMIRNVSSANTVVNSYLIATTGEYYSRNNGTLIADGLTNSDALFNFIGSPLQEIEGYYNINNMRYSEQRMVRTLGKRIQEMSRIAFDKYAEGDIQGYESIMEDIAALIGTRDAHIQPKLDRYVKPEMISGLERVINKELKDGSPAGLSRNILKGNTE